jgi:hypothetical protein
MPNPAYEVQIADAIVAGLNACTFSPPYAQITAVRRDVPDYDGPALSDLHVSVVCPREEMEPARHGDMFTYMTTIVIARHVVSQDDIDDLRRLRQEVVDMIRSRVCVFPGLPENTLLVRAFSETQFDRDSLTDRRVMLASVGVEHKMLRGWESAIGATGA